MSQSWGPFYDAAGDLPRETLLFALERFEGEADSSEQELLAIDLGCGAGRDTAELLRRGWRVLAIDAEDELREVIRADRDSGDPVGMEVGFGQAHIDAGLIGPERSTALQHQDGALLAALAKTACALAFQVEVATLLHWLTAKAVILSATSALAPRNLAPLLSCVVDHITSPSLLTSRTVAIASCLRS